MCVCICVRVHVSIAIVSRSICFRPDQAQKMAKENGLELPKGIEPDEMEAILSQHAENPAVQEW